MPYRNQNRSRRLRPSSVRDAELTRPWVPDYVPPEYLPTSGTGVISANDVERPTSSRRGGMSDVMDVLQTLQQVGQAGVWGSMAAAGAAASYYMPQALEYYDSLRAIYDAYQRGKATYDDFKQVYDEAKDIYDVAKELYDQSGPGDPPSVDYPVDDAPDVDYGEPDVAGEPGQDIIPDDQPDPYSPPASSGGFTPSGSRRAAGGSNLSFKKTKYYYF